MTFNEYLREKGKSEEEINEACNLLIEYDTEEIEWLFIEYLWEVVINGNMESFKRNRSKRNAI